MRLLHKIVVCTLFVLLTALSPSRTHAFAFGEHKRIGDSAFSLVYKQFKDSPFFQRAAAALHVTPNAHGRPVLLDNEFADRCLRLRMTYGDFTALSGDHAYSAVHFVDSLRESQSTLFRQFLIQQSALRAGAAGAGPFALGTEYLLLAYLDKAHFYQFGKTSLRGEFDGMEDFQHRFASIYTATDPDKRAAAFDHFFDTLLSTTTLVKYSFIHSVALTYAGQSARLFANGRDSLATVQMRWALLFNAFADHYLQDSYSAGHHAVNHFASLHWARDPLSLEANGRHDYYSRTGLSLRNSASDRYWTAYGDGFLSSSKEGFDAVISADSISIAEIVTEFNRISADPNNATGTVFGWFDPAQPRNDLPELIQKNFDVYNSLPLPVSSDSVHFGHSINGIAYSVSGDYMYHSSKTTLYRIDASVDLGYNLTPVKSSHDREHEATFSVQGGILPALPLRYTLNLLDKWGLTENSSIYDESWPVAIVWPSVSLWMDSKVQRPQWVGLSALRLGFIWSERWLLNLGSSYHWGLDVDKSKGMTADVSFGYQLRDILWKFPLTPRLTLTASTLPNGRIFTGAGLTLIAY